MKLPLTSELVEYLIKKDSKNPAILALEDEWYGLEVDVKFLSDKELELIEAWVKKGEADKNKRAILRKLKIINRVRKSSEKPQKTLEPLTEIVRNIISELPNKRIYKEDEVGNLLAHYVREVSFEPRDARTETPAHISITLMYWKRGSRHKTSSDIFREELGQNGTTGLGLLTQVLNWQLETEELNKDYKQEIETHKSFHPETGTQFLAFGEAQAHEDTWKMDTINLGSKKNASKVVMDDMQEWGSGRRGDESPIIATKEWMGDFKAAQDQDVVHLPIHPMLRVFDLRTHTFAFVHVNQLSLYKYDTAIAEKLVLPAIKKQMIDTLVNITDEEGSDIIKGKSGGVIILSSGKPGTGKTLTGEVFSEASKKALYVVQCSQLGVHAEELENKLSEVLERATRWGVVLLIDEADVYIHERGNDVNQNAIVGVFLRLLEYYSGILFLTTNRETIVDDAIRSRITAHVRYDLPNLDEQVALWDILSKQYLLKLSPALVEELCKEFPVISGRTIKQLVRLVKVLCRKREIDPSVKLFEEAALFQDIEKRTRTNK